MKMSDAEIDADLAVVAERTHGMKKFVIVLADLDSATFAKYRRKVNELFPDCDVKLERLIAPSG